MLGKGGQEEPLPDSKVHGANIGPIWGRQDPGGPHVGPMNFVIWAQVPSTAAPRLGTSWPKNVAWVIKVYSVWTKGSSVSGHEEPLLDKGNTTEILSITTECLDAHNQFLESK